MAFPETSSQVCASSTQDSGPSSSAVPRVSKPPPDVVGNSAHPGWQRALMTSPASEYSILSKDLRAPVTASPVEKGFVEVSISTEGIPSQVGSKPLAGCKAPECGPSAISPSAAAVQAARGASKASSQILDYTPLSSLPSSGSLMRHLFELRRRQQEQRRKLDASIQSASPTLAAGSAQQPVPNEAAVAPRPPIKRVGCVDGSVFATSTPQSTNLSSLPSFKFSSDKSSIPSSSSIETLSRKPLSHLPLDRVPFDLNTNSAAKNIPLIDTSQACAKTNNVHFDENSPPDQLLEKQKGTANPLTSPYNPEVYRSPPKKEKPLKDEKNLRVTRQSTKPKYVDTINNLPLSAAPRIDDSSVADDDRPISFTNKSFEDLILEKIKSGVYRTSPTDTPAPKKNFLKKGTGTTRFEQPNDYSVMRENKPTSSAREVSHEEDGEVRPKVKFPYLKKGAGTGRFNCKPIKLKKATSRRPDKGTIEKLDCGNKQTLEEPFTDYYSTPIRANTLHAKINSIPAKNDWGSAPFSPIYRYPTKELVELAAFERLEEMADNTSLSSHASTVNSLLQKGLNASTSSSPTDSPCPMRRRVVRSNLTPRKSRHCTNPLQSYGYQANAATRLPQPDPTVNYHVLGSLAQEVDKMPFKEQVHESSSRQTVSAEEKKARTVQFCERGAQVLEYCVSECDTVSEAPTASDASEFLNVSDLEALNQLTREGKLPGSYVSAQFVASRNHPDFVSCDENDHDQVGSLPSAATSTGERFRDNDSAETVIETPTYNRSVQPTSTSRREIFDRREVSARDQKRSANPNHEGKQVHSHDQPQPRHTVLQFSPPRIPPNAASHPIWEAFGSKPQARDSKSVQGDVNVKQPPMSKVGKEHVTDKKHWVPAEQLPEVATEVQSKQAELEAHKVLLVSKVHELEREITTFQTENAQLEKLKDTLHREKEQLIRERKMFEAAVKEDRSRMDDYFEREKRKLWSEKCAMESSKETLEKKNNTLEIINLKEEILLLKREMDRKDSMHNFTQNKLKERIKELDQQKKDLEKKSEKVISLEKENMSLKHQVDRLKLSNKLKPTKGIQSVLHDQKQPNKTALNKSVRFANEPQSHSVPILDIKSTNRNSSFFSNNFGGSLPDIASELSSKSVLSVGSPYDSYLSRIPFSTPIATTTATSAVQDTATSADNNSSLNCSEGVLADGSRVITFANGNKKQVFPSGRVVLEYCNGDWEETLPGRATVYYYSETGTRQTTHHDSGLEEVEFSDGVTEKRLPDGSVDVSFPDGSRTLRRSDGSEEVQLTDGTLVVVAAGGAEKVLHLPNGQREVHGRGFKRREYPDGTVKVLYDDGSTKTIYSSGRVRVKDKEGNLVSDSKHGMDLTPCTGNQPC